MASAAAGETKQVEQPSSTAPSAPQTLEQTMQPEAYQEQKTTSPDDMASAAAGERKQVERPTSTAEVIAPAPPTKHETPSETPALQVVEHTKQEEENESMMLVRCSQDALDQMFQCGYGLFQWKPKYVQRCRTAKICLMEAS